MKHMESDYPPMALEDVPAAEAIILLGGGTRGKTPGGRYADTNAQGDRLWEVVRLWRAGKAPRIIISGGGPEGEISEAQLMADILVSVGVPRSAMVLEERSRNTHDNAVYTAQLLRDQQLDSVLLVTSAFHMRRALACFAAQGVSPIAVPTDHRHTLRAGKRPSWLPTVDGLKATSTAVHETVGYWSYRLRGWL